MDASLSATVVANALHVRAENVIALRPSSLSPEHLDFVGLVRAGEQHQFSPEAVVLHEGQPFIYVIDYRDTRGVSEKDLYTNLQYLGLRADAPYVAVVRPGAVQVYALGRIREDVSPILESAELEPGLLARLVAGVLPTSKDKNTSFSAHELMLGLLNAVTDNLVSIRGLNPGEALALVGRALFMRFLGDRNIVKSDAPIPGISHIDECFLSPHNAAATCRWLDTTFNGDLLELPDHGSLEYFVALDSSGKGSALKDLTAIMCGDTPLGDGVYQSQLSWGDLHFSYLPAGLLSQVYEEYAHRFESVDAKEKSVYYTPRHIAEYMVDHSLKMLGPKAHTARILDPASGGGVFLLVAFRRLVKARWSATGVKPNTQEIRSILNNQLVGMDINPAARQLSALALYLTALELDSDATILENLVFTPLQGKVLIAAEDWIEDSFSPAATEGSVHLGSLSSKAIKLFEGQFDVVIGNPPWTATHSPSRLKALKSIVAEHMSRRLTPTNDSVAQSERRTPINPIPDGVPDLPFVWAATRFGKPNAVIAFALHGRLLTKMSPDGHMARKQIFQGLDVELVLNGMELRNTPVWPDMGAHFCLLFAHNRTASDGSEFYSVTPVRDHSLNREGRVRIDSKDAWTSDVRMVQRTPHLFKTLAKGNALDVELLERVADLKYPTLGDYIEKLHLPAGHGYQTVQTKIAGVDAGFLRGMPVMPVAQQATWRVVPVDSLERFEHAQVHRIREQNIYQAPLVLLRQSPSSKPDCPMSMVALKDVAYSRSYIGYSCKEAPEPELLAFYLSTLFNSSFYLYFVLMTSSFFGCERETQQKAEAELFPVKPLDTLTTEQREQLAEIMKSSLLRNDTKEKGDTFVRSIYNLRSADINLIRDRLELGLPFTSIKSRAITSVDSKTAEAFKDVLKASLAPFDMSVTPTIVEMYEQSALSPWRFFRIGPEGIGSPLNSAHMMASIAFSDLLDASLVEFRHADSLYIGILNQRRYWSRTAARTLALDLIKRGHAVLSRGIE